MNAHTDTRREKFFRRHRNNFELWYRRWIPIVIAFCVFLSVVAVFGTLINQNAQNQSELKQQEVTKELLSCFDAFANRFSNASAEVRQAQIIVDEQEIVVDKAVARRDIALGTVLNIVLAVPEPPAGERLQAFIDLQQKNTALASHRAELVRARHHLQHERKTHPVPDPPSKFCEVEQ